MATFQTNKMRLFSSSFFPRRPEEMERNKSSIECSLLRVLSVIAQRFSVPRHQHGIYGLVSVNYDYLFPRVLTTLAARTGSEIVDRLFFLYQRTFRLMSDFPPFSLLFLFVFVMHPDAPH